MSALINIFSGVLSIIEQLVWIYSWIIIITALLSWVRPDPYNPIVQFLNRITIPAYELVRRFVKKTFYNGIDFAPLIIIITLQIVMLILREVRHAL
ncbi:MAG: YggT family protein [Campylobacterota bacterium]